MGNIHSLPEIQTEGTGKKIVKVDRFFASSQICVRFVVTRIRKRKILLSDSGIVLSAEHIMIDISMQRSISETRECDW